MNMLGQPLVQRPRCVKTPSRHRSLMVKPSFPRIDGAEVSATSLRHVEVAGSKIKTSTGSTLIAAGSCMVLRSSNYLLSNVRTMYIHVREGSSHGIESSRQNDRVELAFLSILTYYSFLCEFINWIRFEINYGHMI